MARTDHDHVLRELRSAVRRAEEALIEQAERHRDEKQAWEHRFRVAFDAANFCMALVSPEGVMLQVNPALCQLLSYEPDELTGRHFNTITVDDDANVGIEVRDRLLRGETDASSFEKRWRKKDGTLVWVAIRTRLVRSAGGEPLYFVSHMEDITNRKRDADLRKRFLEQVIAAQEEERRRIARELHDETGQSLTSLAVSLRTIEDALADGEHKSQIQLLRARARDLLGNIQRLARGLHPSLLDDLGLVAATQRYVQDWASAHGIPADLHVNGFDREPPIPSALALTLYRVLQESLTNVAKHADAKAASVVLDRQADAVRAIIEDDGRGMLVEGATGLPANAGGLGLLGIRERVALFNGTVTIESKLGTGTCLYINIPLA